MEPEKDELWLDGVGFPAGEAPSDALRDALWRQTSGIVRRRAYRRRFRLSASWAVAYAAGLATAWLIWSRSATPHAPKRPGAEEQQVAAVEPVAPADVQAQPAVSPEELRSRVLGAPRAEQIRLLRLAGDRYLFGQADVESALDCYRQVIELSPRDALVSADEDDSWLLAELKSSAAGSMGQVASE